MNRVNRHRMDFADGYSCIVYYNDIVDRQDVLKDVLKKHGEPTSCVAAGYYDRDTNTVVYGPNETSVIEEGEHHFDKMKRKAS
jgi:hypothetical protein